MKLSKTQSVIILITFANLSILGVLYLSIVYEPEVFPDSSIWNKKNVAVVYPSFSHSAYSENGFYAYYKSANINVIHDVDTVSCGKKCLTVSLDAPNPNRYNLGIKGFEVLKDLNYSIISDIMIDKNPSIVNKFQTIIVLHNEYMTQKEFDALYNHHHVIYLYPNAGYAKISVNYTNNTITLLRGHGYPDKNITNGFDWKWDNSKYEQRTCPADYPHFSVSRNGYMVECYPEKYIKINHALLAELQRLS